MDARHRDKVAFIRVCSGRFEKGMKVRVARTGARQQLGCQPGQSVRSGLGWPGSMSVCMVLTMRE
jgi:translation elongation factor EF-G